MTKIIRILLGLPQFLLISLIRFYQRYLSPRKGFCCAYRQYSGGRSCSHFALTAIRRHGVSALWLSFPKRLAGCQAAAISLSEQNKEKKKRNQCEYYECLDACSCAKDFNLRLPIQTKKPFHLSFSAFFLLKWLYKLSLRKRHK